MKDIRDKLLALSDRHADELQSRIALADSAASKLYRHIAEVASGSRRYEALERDLTRLVQSVRVEARDLAVAHVLAELRVIAGAGVEHLSIPMGVDPVPQSVQRYVNNCVDAARESVNSDVDASGEAFVSTDYRAHTVIESEATSQYQHGRETAVAYLRRLPGTVTVPLGFAVARETDQLRDIDGIDTREAGGWIALIGERWNARGSACEKCKAADGEIRAFGFAFSLPGPSAHARCQCVRTLWAVATPLDIGREYDMARQNDEQRGIARSFIELELDERQVDDVTRTIRDAVASTEALDSHGTRIIASGWNLDRYKRNPVLIWAHSATNRTAKFVPEDILGTATVRVEGKKLMADLHFSPKGLNPQADMVFEQMKARIVRGLSVGFGPNFKYHVEKDDTVVIESAELIELSVAPIPSNPETLARELRSFCTANNAANPQEHNMTDENKVAALPTEIAALTKCETIEDAVRFIAELNLKADQLTQERDAAVVERDAVKAELQTRIENECKSEVDSLIKSGRIQEANRDSALTLLRSAPDAFRSMYPRAAEAAPMAHLLQRVVPPAKPEATPEPQFESNPIVARADKLQADNKALSREEALNQATREYLKNKRPAI